MFISHFQELISSFDQKSVRVMDVKMGCRTFLEEQVTEPKLRADLFEKMIKLDPDYPTSHERAEGKCTKLRYMQLREQVQSYKDNQSYGTGILIVFA